MVMSLARLSMTLGFRLLHTLINFVGHNMDLHLANFARNWKQTIILKLELMLKIRCCMETECKRVILFLFLSDLHILNTYHLSTFSVKQNLSFNILFLISTMYSPVRRPGKFGIISLSIIADSPKLWYTAFKMEHSQKNGREFSLPFTSSYLIFHICSSNIFTIKGFCCRPERRLSSFPSFIRIRVG